MLRRLFLLAVVSTWPACLVAQARGADSAAILGLIKQRAEAMRTLRADLQAASYAPDAVWINAFGVRRTGRDSIVAFLRGLYADSGFRESRLLREEPPELIFVRPEVAIVHEFHEREGQRLADGTVVSRRTHTSFVVSKESGRWLIRYQYIADERPRSRR
ncbi:MAG: SgcJ/EcaC family oxidoreductase [Cytophagaceae bacterium]|nr:SgcJ/EcaC family oxidoreductase [Gemmatimonadaceae bacterium]